MSRWSLGISSLWSPKKRAEEAALAPSPLAEQHPNRIQKLRDNRSKTYSRKGKAHAQRVAAGLANSSVLEELGDDRGSPASRRRSIAGRSYNESEELMIDLEESAFDSNENEDPESDDDRVKFASQPAHISSLSPESEFATQDQDVAAAVVTATPDEPAGDEVNLEDPPVVDEEDPPRPQDDTAEAPASDAELEEEDSDSDDDEQYTFTDLLDYRWDDDAIDIQVQWHGTGPTWEPEANLHRDAPDALFRFWDAQGGRPDNPRDPGLFDIFAIRGHRKNRQRLLVEWTGYPPSENSWVSRRLVQQTAPEVVDDYMKSISPKKKK